MYSPKQNIKKQPLITNLSDIIRLYYFYKIQFLSRRHIARIQQKVNYGISEQKRTY